MAATASLNDQDTKAPTPSRVNTERRNAYLHHTTVVTELAGKDEQFKEAAARAMSSARRAEEAKETLTRIRDAESQLNSQLEILRKKKLKSKLFPKKTAAQASKLENSISAANEDAAAAKQKASLAKTAWKKDAKYCHTLKTEAEKLKASEKGRRDILEDVFGGEAGDDVENQIETERDRLKEVTFKAKDRLDVQKASYGLLRKALVELMAARKSLLDAQVSNTVDIFSGGGIGFIAGIGSQYNINAAGKMARSAGEKIQQAMELNPKLPIARMAKVQDGVILSFADIVLDGFITDILIRLTIEKSVKSVNGMIEMVKQSLDVQRSVVEKLHGRVRNYSDDLKRTSEDLDRVRADLLKNIIVK